MLVPNWTFLAEVAAAIAVLALVWIWPLIRVGRSRQWTWFLAVLAFGPVAVVFWLLLTKGDSRSRPRSA